MLTATRKATEAPTRRNQRRRATPEMLQSAIGELLARAGARPSRRPPPAGTRYASSRSSRRAIVSGRGSDSSGSLQMDPPFSGRRYAPLSDTDIASGLDPLGRAVASGFSLDLLGAFPERRGPPRPGPPGWRGSRA